MYSSDSSYFPTIFLGFPIWGSRLSPFIRGLSHEHMLGCSGDLVTGSMGLVVAWVTHSRGPHNLATWGALGSLRVEHSIYGVYGVMLDVYHEQ